MSWLILLIFQSVLLNAQTIQLGAGTGESWEQNSSPVNIYYRRTVCQMVYTAQELQDAFASSTNPISEMGFYVVESPIYTLRQYTIKMKHVGVNDVSSPLGTTGWTTVVNSFNYSPTAGGFDMIPLDTPFLWDGTSSIGVEVCWSRVNPTWNASGKVRIYGTANGYRYSWTDNNGSSCGSTPNTVTTDKPQIQLVFVGGTTTNWTGAIDTDWFNEGNWSAGIPNPIMDAVIPTGLTNYPNLIGSGAKCNNLTIEPSASLEINTTDSLQVYGNWNNDGLFIANESTVLFKGFGATPNTVDAGGAQTFYNFEVRSEGGVTLNSGSYNIAGNLRLRGGTFTSNNLVTLTSDLANTGRLTRIQNFCDYQLIMSDSYGDGWNGGYITFKVDGEIVDSYNAEGTGTTVNLPLPDGARFSLTYNAGRYEGENTYTLVDNTGSTIFSDGPGPSTGEVFTATASCPFSNTYVGDLTVNRYLSIPNNEWRELSSGLNGQTLGDYQDDGIIMTNFPGSNYPTFGWTSVYAYQENNANGVKEDGWVEPTSIADPVYPDAGHRIYIGSGNYTTSMTGTPITGNFNYSLDYQNITPAEIAATEEQKGWNLIGNPYPCSVSWDSIDAANKVNMIDAIWIWSGSAGNYGVYVGGAGSGTNDVGNSIASSQAFWVHATAPGASLLIEEEDKVETDPTFVKNGMYHNLHVELKGGNNGFHDEIVIAENGNASNSFDDYDAYKLFSPLPSAPQLYMLGKDNYLSINSFEDLEAKHIPIGAHIPTDGNYELVFKNMNHMENLSCLILEDKYLGYLHDVLADSIFSFSANSGTLEDRFILHISNYGSGNTADLCQHFSAVNSNYQTASVKVHPNPTQTGFLNIESSNKINQVQVVDILGQLVKTEVTDSFNTRLATDDLTNGIYFLRVSTEQGIELIKFEVMD
ncbi:T9SS type A sorting domain-containing protein [Parvicella tangerina]|uniref:T9SS type A sorting domain-containing protein n=1 Tax=Parvicella tangerina TaxID=2829795 RepID=UPI00215C0408|nr:T9SS type A sorting domain-containing protein [Parvicella tangerina]